MFFLALISAFWVLSASYDVCREKPYFTHYCPDNYKCCGEDGIHCCPIDHTLKFVGIGIVVAVLVLVIFSIIFIYTCRNKTRAMSKVDIAHEDKIPVSLVKSWDKQGGLARLEAAYLHAEEQEAAAWELETQNANDGLQKQQIELELAENRSKIATEILEKAQKGNVDSFHIDQALNRKISCDSRVLKSRILWDLAIELTKRDAATLAAIIEKSRRKKIKDEERILKWAREMLFFLESKDYLDKALLDGSYEELSNALTKVRELGYEKKCAKLVFRAMLKTERIERFQNLLKGVLEMNHMQMQDLVAYTDPDEEDENPSPDSLCKVLQATAEFLGGDEECWMELQSMVTRMGEGSLKRRAMCCEIELIPQQTLSHAAKLLESIDATVVKEECSHALPLFRWCNAIIEERYLMEEEFKLFTPPSEEEKQGKKNSKKGKKSKRVRMAQA